MPLEEQLDQITSQMEKEFKKKMIDRGLTQQELANMFKVNRSSISLAISGSPSRGAKEIRKKLRKILGINDRGKKDE